MRRAVQLTLPQPCAESWAAMTPTAAGRHCAACAKTVVDFTLKSDAEILAYFARAAGASTCGRLAASQLGRPLQTAPLAASPTRWRAWLAAAGAVWALREGAGIAAPAQAPTEWRARYWGGPLPAMPPPATEGPADSTMNDAAVGATETSFVVRGVVRDSVEHLGLPGVTVLLKNTQIGVPTDEHGGFELVVPAHYVTTDSVEIRLSYIGYESQLHRLAVDQPAPANRFYLKPDTRMLSGEVMIGGVAPRKLPPAPWHPRRFYYWGKYWLTRPFRR